MACKVCREQGSVSVHRNGFIGNKKNPTAGPMVRFVVHSGVGVPIVKCKVCGFMSAEFVHPRVINIIYETPPLAFVPKDMSKHRELHKENSRKQVAFLLPDLPKLKTRALFLGVGRSENSEQYCQIFDDVILSDLVPMHNKILNTRANLQAIPFSGLRNPILFQTFDLIILSNILERIVFPLSLLRLCANLLKEGGRLLLETPNISESDVYSSRYGREEINFFSSQSLGKLTEIEGNFNIIKSEEFDEPAALRDATYFGLQSRASESLEVRSVIRLVLENNRKILESNLVDIEQQDIPQYLEALSFASLISTLGLSRFTDIRSDETNSLKRNNNPTSDHFDH